MASEAPLPRKVIRHLYDSPGRPKYPEAKKRWRVTDRVLETANTFKTNVNEGAILDKSPIRESWKVPQMKDNQ
jgi:hypothetical protein